jgi:hypothetical protein
MDVIRRAAGYAVLLAAVASPSAQQPGPPEGALPPARMEAFLLEAEITRIRSAGGGVTDSKRATLTDGQLTHDAHVQDVDEERARFDAGDKSEIGFKDSYKFNIAAYHLAQLIGLQQVPMSVERRVSGKPSSVTWWVDDVQMDEGARAESGAVGPNSERFFKQVYVMYVFDELIQNRDRNLGNMLWTTDFTMWLIDHTRAFRIGRNLEKPERLLRIDRALLDGLRGLTSEALEARAGRWLTGREIDAVIARRDKLVAHFEERIGRMGDTAVLYSW